MGAFPVRIGKSFFSSHRGSGDQVITAGHLKMKQIIAALVFFVSTAATVAQTFNMTPDQFVERYNTQLKMDHGDQIKACSHSASEMDCKFFDDAFQHSVREFKKLNLVNGDFEMATKLTIFQSKGKVAVLLLLGDRSDMMNLMHFVGQLGSLLATLDPKADKDAVTNTVLALGVMRGDSDPGIGEPKVEIEDYAAITCNSQPSSKTTAVGCKIDPRY